MDDIFIKQIMPAPDNLYVVYKDEQGEFESKIICLALLNNSEVIMMDSDGLGEIEEAQGFERIVYK